MSESLPRLAFVNGGLGHGGATTLLCILGGELVRRGVPVLVLSLEQENPFASDFAALKVPLVMQDERRSIFEDRVRATVEALAEFRPTAVIGCVGAASYEPLRYVPAGVTRALMVQADYPIHYNGAAPYGAFVDAVIGVSEQIRQTLASMPQFRGVPSYYLTSGVSVPETFIPRRCASGAPLRILYLGRLERRQKRVDLFPRMLKQLIKSGIPFVWTIVGEGPDAEFLAQTMKTQRPDQQVRLTGPVPYRAVPQYLENNDILLLPSQAEGLPLCVLEGMAYGLVPVVTDLSSGIRELLNDSNGRRIPLEKIDDYAEAMIELYRKPQMMEELSRNARKTIEQEFSTQIMAERWLKTFPSLGTQVEWPRNARVRGPLTQASPMRFSPAGRLLRRLALRGRALASTLQGSAASD